MVLFYYSNAKKCQIEVDELATYTPFKPGRKVHTRQVGSMGGVKAGITGYNQSVTGCGSQRKQCSCNSTKTYVSSNLI